MEPISVATALGKLLSTGYSIYKAVKGHGDDFELDLKAYESLVALGSQLGNWLPKDDTSAKMAAQALAVLTVAFGKAFHECFGAQRVFDDTKRLQANLTAAVEWAQPSESSDSKVPPLSLADVCAEPEKTPYFAALWSAFTQRNLPGKAGRSDISTFSEPLIEKTSGPERARFEQVFRRNVGTLLASPGSRDLSLALLRTDQDADRARWVERLLIGDMATWNQRHVFGNVKGHETLPEMPLGIMYVEPNAKWRKEGRKQTPVAPIRTTLLEALKKNSLIVVTADFGHGKSLTARTLAYEAAQTFLSDGSKPSAELDRPIFVKCQTAFSTSHIELAQAVRRAQWLALKDDLGIQELAESDAALSPPSKKQRTLFLLDGLDEVAFLERDILHFFEQLRGQLTAHHRAIVFSRPHSLPAEKLREWGVPVYELQPFDTKGENLGQAGQWLSRWNTCSKRPSIEPSALRTDGLADLAGTPILLFMIAYTWGDLNALYADWHPPAMAQGETDDASQTQLDLLAEAEAAWDRKNRIYEAFFRAIAWGKYERDRESHPAIIKAARVLHEALEARSLLASDEGASTQGQDNPQTTERARLTHAMLWLMGRVAWHARCLQQQSKPRALTRSHVDRILEEELELDDPKVADVARDGLLLAMQADLSESSRPILFGHQSFREFLVARCWTELLRVIIEPQTSVEQKAGLIKILRAGRLLEEDDRSFAFLRARLRQWPQTEQHSLYQWALAEFENDAIEMQPPTLRGDSRRDFRATSLALASVVAPRAGLSLRDPSQLRSLLASYWIVGHGVRHWMPRLQAKKIFLFGANLAGANLAGANLERANLAGANLYEANLYEANLAGANLYRVNLERVNLEKANLEKAHLVGARFPGASLAGASLAGAFIYDANLSETNLAGVNLAGAHLYEANLARANLLGTQLAGSNLAEANLTGANLAGANLAGANLAGANLAGANLDGANLAEANLAGATIEEEAYAFAQAQGALLDEFTQTVRWPRGSERIPWDDVEEAEESSNQNDAEK